MEIMKKMLCKIFGCKPGESKIEEHFALMCLPCGETEEHCMRLEITCCQRCERVMNVQPRGFADLEESL